VTTQPQKSFADRLKSLREKRALSSYALAKLTGLTKQSLSQLERGESQPSWQTVQLLATALGVDCREFADPNVKPPPAVEAMPRGRPRKAAAPEEPAKKPRRKKGE
jgi:transcriptional regulator with XRE-family HTH domain